MVLQQRQMASLAGNYIARINLKSHNPTVILPPTPDQGDKLRTIGKAYSGLTDDEILETTKTLKSIIIKDGGTRITVRPEIILEVAFDSIQKSNRQDSGFALRFPRIKNIREDKNVSDMDSLQNVKQIYEKQTYIMNK